MNALKTSLGCLFIALALNTAFTFAIPQQQQDRPWMQISSGGDSHKPESTIIKTTAIPSVTKVTPTLWIITFRGTNNP
jgi:hypothetical protein